MDTELEGTASRHIGPMRFLIYRRTHCGDPCIETKLFGENDCMGQVRDREFDAVIGIGGTGVEPRSWGIDRRINWIGITPTKVMVPGLRAPALRFDEIWIYEHTGPLLEFYAPAIADRFYRHPGPRVVMELNQNERSEAAKIVELARSNSFGPELTTMDASKVHSRGACTQCKPKTNRKPRYRGCGCC